MELVVEGDGAIRCIYGEELNLHALGRISIKRGSHVEPTSDGQWTADLAPVSGPVLGPFFQRTDALHAEHCWLERHWLTRSEGSDHPDTMS